MDLGTPPHLPSDGALTAVVDRCYPLEEASEAMRYPEEGHARGKIVVTV